MIEQNITQNRPTKVFISYRYSDWNEYLEKFINDLKQIPNISVWLAKNQLEIGNDVFSSITKAISECDYFIRIGSQFKSNWFDTEFHFAYAEQLKTQNLKIITVFLTPPLPHISLPDLKYSHYFDLSHNYKSGFQLLLDYLVVNSSNTLVSFSLGTSVERQTIIDISYKVNDDLFTYFRNNPNELKTMDRRLFEEFIAELFRKFQFEVELTKQTRDGGFDIIAIKRAEANLKYLIECKRPEPGNLIGVKPVRELYAVKQTQEATKAILATTSFFTKDAIMEFERKQWELELVDFNGITKWIDNYKRIR